MRIPIPELSTLQLFQTVHILSDQISSAQRLVSFCVATVVALSHLIEVHIRVATLHQGHQSWAFLITPPRWLSTGWKCATGSYSPSMHHVCKLPSCLPTALSWPFPQHSTGSLQAAVRGRKCLGANLISGKGQRSPITQGKFIRNIHVWWCLHNYGHMLATAYAPTFTPSKDLGMRLVL